MSRRSERYEIGIVRADDTTEVIQVNSRKVDAIKRADFVAADYAGWPTVTKCYVRDTMAWGDSILHVNYRT